MVFDAAYDNVCGTCLEEGQHVVWRLGSPWSQGTEDRVSHSQACDDAVLAAAKIRITP